jgi:uncharacterized membrane protein HdeD (DUF308 family)
MKNKNVSLISGILWTIIGFVIFFNPDIVVKFISYFVGGVLIAVGAYKIINYRIKDKNLGVVNTNEMAFGISALVLGILFIFLAGTIELIVRFIMGGYLIIAGVARLYNTFYTTDRDSKFYALIIMGFLFIAVGLYIILVSNVTLSILGLLMAIYGIIDIVSFFVYKDSFVFNKNDKKEIGIKEAEVVEEKEDDDEEKEEPNEEPKEDPKDKKKGKKK